MWGDVFDGGVWTDALAAHLADWHALPLSRSSLSQVPINAGPAPDSDQNSHLFLYHSAVNPTRHENSGLVGGIVITRKGEANPDGTPQGVDREIVTVFQV